MTPKIQHTSGPWYAWGRNQADGWITDSVEPDSDTVPHGTNIIAKVQKIGHWPTFDANARLIAAAPELLAACEAWLTKVDHEGKGNCCGCAYMDETEQTKAAIAKATSPQAR